ncbi:hypothetical protein F5144DRAFT_606086 [Chaetomium tenue]|uniref:Uncharacterized protein n=1 Tax=Chaetomium tenue TaxID=1854479 RepID=A0ACB7P3M1_9PEZI|nr:hypothetical protein F5144DRAFT_606086 [Chaetomium globosum]
MGTRCTECGLLWSQRVAEPVQKKCTKCKYGYRKCTACNGVGETLTVTCSKYKTHNKS